MRKNLVLLLFIFITSVGWSQPIPVKINHTVIIDTDCGIDDMRAISILLDRPEITVKAILLSDGSLPPEEGAVRVNELLNSYNIHNIPVATGEEIKEINPPWREFNRQVSWGPGRADPRTQLSAAGYLADVLRKTQEQVILVCLGPLTNIAAMETVHPELNTKIERIIWYNESPEPSRGFNYECDKTSADILFKSGLRIDVISNLNKENVLFNSALVEMCSNSDTRLARALSYVFSQKPVTDKLRQDHFLLCDDLVSLYLTNPELFDINVNTNELNIRYDNNYNVQGVREAFSDMIKGLYVSERNIVFNRFPVDPEMFNYDIRPIIDSVIARYGYEEWKANVMTDEFHGHLGVFSIVGAKMGIKAREIFGVGPDMLEVISFAGSEPPYSCLNDGIQVSTGATAGMGTIHVARRKKTQPSAIFTYNNRSVRITLKKEYLERVDADIKEGIRKFGLLDDGYWKLIRRNAIKYWLEWDRNKIFDIEENAHRR